MLLRITQAQGGGTDAHPKPSTESPLHACLATAASANATASANQSQTQTQSIASQQSTEEGGTILTIGRKNCIIVHDDKCVSRKHATIRLISNIELDIVGPEVVQFGSWFGTPQNEEEREAVASSNTGIICVLKDCGSKFGTFVSVNETETAATKNVAKETTDGDETGDETDVESKSNAKCEVLNEKQIKAVQILQNSTSNEDASKMKFQKLEPNSSTILFPLSHSTPNESHVTILLGPQGTALRLTLLPLQFTFSRLSSKESDRLLPRLPTIGATYSSRWNSSSTHLITKESKATAKHIVAWACCKPAVTEDYVLALLTRRDCRDAMPREEEYVPPGNGPLNVPLESPCRVLRGYRIAVLVEDDGGPLAESGGAELLEVYNLVEGGDLKDWWEEQAKRAQRDKMTLVVMETASKKATGWMKCLKALGCRFTNQKNLAKAITAKDDDVALLMDVNKEIIERVKGWDEEVEETVEFDNNHSIEEVIEEKPPEEYDSDATGIDEEDKMPVTTRGTKRSKEREEATTHEDGAPKSKRSKVDNGEGSLKDKVEEPPPEPEPSPKKSPSRTKRSRQESRDDASGKDNSAPPTKMTAKSTSNAPSKKVIIDEESDNDSVPDEDKRLSLPMTEDGWFVAATGPRKNYRKKIDDIEDADEENPKHPAKTARVKGLIVREYVPPAPRTMSRRNGNKKDFKRFRKNHVIRGFTSFSANGKNNSSQPRVRLVSVLPKESERQKELEMQQELLDKEQAYADALFDDSGNAGKKGRRSGGSITGFLSQPTKRGRARR